MEYLVIWFIVTASVVMPSYIEPQDVRAPQCGNIGLIVGIIADRVINPTTAFFPDPQTFGLYCKQDISAKVAALPPGEFHLATTEMGKTYPAGQQAESYIGIDPHTSPTYIRNGEPMIVDPTPIAPFKLRILPPPPFD